jgi:hypothetical protein
MHSNSSLSLLGWLRRNILRSTLTAGCLFICTLLTVLIADLGDGSDGSGGAGFDDLSKSISITSGPPHSNQAMGIQSLSDSDVDALNRGLDPSVVADVVPIASGHALVRHGSAQFRGTLAGSTPDYLAYKSIPLVAGRMFTSSEYQDDARVTLLGPNIVKALFPKGTNSALGAKVVVGRLTFTVIGVVEHDATGNGGWSIISPLTTVRYDLLGGVRTVGEIGLVATSPSTVAQATAQATKILEDAHTPKKGQFNNDFSANTFQSANNALVTQVLRALRYFVLGTIVVSYVIGLIGLVSITREAARSGRLGLAFLQAAGNSLGAGIFGVAVGAGLIEIATRHFATMIPAYIHLSLSINAVTIALGLSLLGTVVATLFPLARPSRGVVTPQSARSETDRQPVS